MTLPYDAVEQIRHDGGAFIKLVAGHDENPSIAACPAWYLDDLVWHVAGVWHFWSEVVDRRIIDVGELRSIERPDRPAADALIDFLYAAHVHLCDTLNATPTDTAVWTWTGANRDAAWVQRRMAQETTVHLWDAAKATGTHHAIPTAVAADGIDEFLMWFAASNRAEGEMKVGGTVHLHCTDTGPDVSPQVNGEWFISAMKEPAATFTREHRKGDAAIRGTAHDLLLWLWRRDDGPVEVLGDPVVARRFRAFTELI